MRRLLSLLLLVTTASGVSAECTQAEFADRWDFFAQGVSCQFYLDEQGELYKARCDQLFGSLADQYVISPSGRISVNSYCRVSGSIIVDVFDQEGGSLVQDLAWNLVGRANLDKSLIEGESESNYIGFYSSCRGSDDGNCYIHFSMVKY